MDSVVFLVACVLAAILLLYFWLMRFKTETRREFWQSRIFLTALMSYFLAVSAGEVFFPFVYDKGSRNFQEPLIVFYVSFFLSLTFSIALGVWWFMIRKKKAAIILWVVMCFILECATLGRIVGFINGVFDASPPQTRRVQVIGKKIQDRALELANWHPGKPDVVVDVDRATYHNCRIGDTVSIRTAPGFLGLERLYDYEKAKRVRVVSPPR